MPSKDASIIDTIADLLARRRDAMARCAQHGGDEGSRAVADWSAADHELTQLVTKLAGPAPSAVKLADGSIVCIVADEFEELPPHVAVIPPTAVVSLDSGDSGDGGSWEEYKHRTDRPLI